MQSPNAVNAGVQVNRAQSKSSHKPFKLVFENYKPGNVELMTHRVHLQSLDAVERVCSKSRVIHLSGVTL